MTGARAYSHAMRGVPLAAVMLALGATAAPASAADVNIANFSFSPTPITIALGDTVTWHYNGPDTNHSVTSDSGQADSWDSDPGRFPTSADHPPTTTFAHTFNTAGSFTYFCKVHTSMHGRVIVQGPGGEPPPDTTPPEITGLTARGGRTCSRAARRKGCRPVPTTLRYTLSEDATLKLSVRGRPAASTTKTGKAGANKLLISTRKLPPGRWTVKLTATDAAGNASAPASAKVTVRRRQ